MKKLIIYALAIVACAAHFACKKELNALPENSRVSEVAIIDAKTAEIALNGAYYTFANTTPLSAEERIGQAAAQNNIICFFHQRTD